MQHNELGRWYNMLAAILSQMPHELSLRQWLILSHIYLLEGEHSIKNLAYVFDLPKASVSRAVSSLVRYGLIKRRKSDADKRNIYLHRTMKGISFMNQFNDILANFGNNNTSQQAEYNALSY
jgi:DNA-binding MarR family transcriptional regulator